ncbi:hypothetical protein GJU40_17365 [Bacillus lacus]|uniref:DUF3993 domain-containing protein n=1 Tax=Metabacillus lacus TaxID=1983721 RepID=A0A7X2J1U1_9BACI|nr:hypothetical protein [Metabacillus lacus]MRX73907.1 hypothetical protein [Metabacillus lacus]
MKKLLLFTVMMIAAGLLSSCNNSEKMVPIEEETLHYDRNRAAEIIKEKEELILQLAMKKTISGLEYREFEKAFSEEFGQHAQLFLKMFVSENSENSRAHDVLPIEETFYPTLFHKEIALTDAVVHSSYYEDEFLHSTYLSIKQAYTGDDDMLENWEREYIFSQNEAGEWEIHGFSGVMNFTGEEYNMHYLELKSDESHIKKE